MAQQELQVRQKREVEKRQQSTIPSRVFLRRVLKLGSRLTINGQIDFSKYEGLQPLYIDYNIGNYSRSLDGMTAELKDGVVTLVVPKSEKAKPRRISVS